MGEAPLTYCMQEAGDLPCHRIIVCWQAFFPVEAYLKEKKLSPQKWDEFADKKPKGNIASLLSLIEEAKSRGTKSKRVEQKGGHSLCCAHRLSKTQVRLSCSLDLWAR